MIGRAGSCRARPGYPPQIPSWLAFRCRGVMHTSVFPVCNAWPRENTHHRGASDLIPVWHVYTEARTYAIRPYKNCPDGKLCHGAEMAATPEKPSPYPVNSSVSPENVLVAAGESALEPTVGGQRLDGYSPRSQLPRALPSPPEPGARSPHRRFDDRKSPIGRRAVPRPLVGSR